MGKINFWELINSFNQIVIPTIQRNYAQGRVGEEFLRENFLSALRKAILSSDESDNLTLDFVYGVESGNGENSRFLPLDGQQRLTTLWLLHWYIAFKAGILEEVKEILERFSYETRNSSSQFCKDLCSLKPEGKEENEPMKPLREWIMQQTWYYYHYTQDPTVQAMLNMICGTGVDEKDGIDEAFSKDDDNRDFSQDDYKEIWERLTNEDQRVAFYKLKINLEDGDDLYIKMNARGRQLSNFENFKAELVEHVKHVMGDNYATEFARKMDVDWTDIFWPNRHVYKSGDATIDDIYFAFIRRFVYNECIRCIKDTEKVKQLTFTYTSFDIYREILNNENIEKFVRIMDNIRGNKFDVSCKWEEFNFIPEYKNLDKGDTEKQRLVFYAICKYFEVDKYEENSFNNWKRVVWNICENRTSDIKGAIELFEALAPYSHSINEYLCKRDIDYTWKNNKEQMEEEVQKAKHLNDYPEIIEIESYAFFKGAIRFLFTNCDGRVDWSFFSKKIENAKRYFVDNGVQKEYITESKLLRRYISLLNEDNWKITFDDNASSWRERLLNKDLAKQNHDILVNNDILTFDYKDFKSDYNKPVKRYAHQFLVRHDIFTIAVSECLADLNSSFCRGSVTLHPYNAKAGWKYYVIHPRTELLFDEESGITFSDPNLGKCREKRLMFGKNISFKYKDHCFEWYASPQDGEADIYLKGEDWIEYLVVPGMENEKTDLKRLYCFDVGDVFKDEFECKRKEFLDKLDGLIDKYDRDIAKKAID